MYYTISIEHVVTVENYSCEENKDFCESESVSRELISLSFIMFNCSFAVEILIFNFFLGAFAITVSMQGCLGVHVPLGATSFLNSADSASEFFLGAFSVFRELRS